jgi:hypothetical protein
MALRDVHYVYGLKNQNGLYFYIGMTTAPEYRFNQHIYAAKGGRNESCSQYIRDELGAGRKIRIDILHTGDRMYCLRKEGDEIVAKLQNGEPILNKHKNGTADSIREYAIERSDTTYITIEIPFDKFRPFKRILSTKKFEKAMARHIKEYIKSETKEYARKEAY